MLSLYIDFKCPASYLALAPTRALANHLGTNLLLRPFRSRAERIPMEQENETKGETHRRVRALQRRRIQLKYAALQGVQLVFRDDPGDTDLALAALSCNLNDPERFAEHAFAAYWQNGENLDDITCVEKLLAATTNERTTTELARARDRLDQERSTAENAGVFTTPTYLIDDKIFVGREHLPWIKEILSNQRGTI